MEGEQFDLRDIRRTCETMSKSAAWRTPVEEKNGYVIPIRSKTN